jgi:peptidoglycan/xylan/chitin deacetylase (PgdA/CDA1 family)
LSDLDRPFEIQELQDFARNRWVSLGNHTADHTILTHCSEQEAGFAIAEGRRQLEGLTGKQVRAIAYPNGDCSGSVVDAARREGHQLGFTCVAKANPLPLASSAPMTIGRHLVWGGRDYAREIPKLSASFLPGARLRSALRELF